jgi:signal transduction histidine kinase
VVDDGCGYDQNDPSAASKGGMGLRTMQETLAKVDGKLEIRSAPGKGTKVIATIYENKIPSAARNKG